MIIEQGKYRLKKITFDVIGFFVIITVFIFRKINIYFFMYPDAFGHQAMNIEYYGRKIALLSGKNKCIMISFPRGKVIPNKALFDHHVKSGIIMVGNNLLTKILRWSFTLQKKLRKNNFNIDAFMMLNMTDLLANADIHIKSKVAFPFDNDENKSIDKVLSNMSLSNGNFYLFQDRNVHYHKKRYLNKDHEHDVFNNGRIEFIEDFEDAAKVMGDIGIKAVRMGSESEPVKRISNIIDYPNIYRSKLGSIADLALIDRCKFFVGPNSGITCAAIAFNKPLLYCNVFPWPWMHIPMNKNSVSMPKKLWMIDKKRMMTLQEMIKMESEFYYKKIHYDMAFFKSLKIEVVNNSSEEIMLATLEINSRIDGTWDGENYKLNKMLKNNIGCNSNSVLSTSFADLNKDIMGSLYKG